MNDLRSVIRSTTSRSSRTPYNIGGGIADSQEREKSSVTTGGEGEIVRGRKDRRGINNPKRKI